jgi:acetoin utilization deacetylase AcuC-like enzyme
MEEMTRVHPQDYVEAILGIQPAPGEHVHVDGDTVMSQGSAEAIRRAAGAVVAGVDAVMQGKVRTAFAAVRPPGHHAAPDVPGGFCLINNAAVGARHAQAKYGVERVAIVDFDVHHGQGTQAVVEPDPTLFYASTHQYPLYPGTGSPRETGTDNNVVNVPLRAGSGSAEFRAAWSERILPLLDDFAPELVIVSAGFDAHRADPLAGCRLESGSFAEMARHVRDFAERLGVPLGVVLEGGYEPAALAECVVETLAALAGEQPPSSAAPDAPLTSRAAAQLAHYWPL